MAPAEPAVACPIGGKVSLVTAAMATIKKKSKLIKRKEKEGRGRKGLVFVLLEKMLTQVLSTLTVTVCTLTDNEYCFLL